MEENKQIQQETNLRDDAVKSAKARNIVVYCQDQLKNFEGKSKVVKKYKNGHFNEVRINFEDFKVFFTEGPSLGGAKARFFPDKKVIVLYSCPIEDKDNGKISVKFDEDTLFQELLHYFDVKGDEIKSDPVPIANEPVMDEPIPEPEIQENNSGFVGYVLPKILESIKSRTPKTFSEFRNTVTNEAYFKTWYNELGENDKSKSIKNLDEYWNQVLSTSPANLEEATYSFWNTLEQKQKLKDVIKEIVKKNLRKRNLL